MASFDEEYSKIVSDLRKSFRNGKMQSQESRLTQLKQLHRMIDENEKLLFDALKQDLHKHNIESKLCETLQVKVDVGHAIKNLSSWMKPERVKSDLINKLNTCELQKDPLGVVLIIGAWNYPVLLNFMPLIGAIAAGNCAIIKPSECAEKSAQVIAELVPKYLDQDCVRVANGGIPETTALLRQRFDHIFYTGSPFVGKIVMRAAAEHLTPVTLELGGKCPLIVDSKNNMDNVAQRITWAKFMNAGQTCLAVDYILCIGDVQDKLVKSLKKAITKFYSDDPKTSECYGRIINKRHWQRVSNLINKDKVVFGGDIDEKELYISPTIMSNVTTDDKIMGEEIFGPILPILTVDSIEEAANFINEREKPLALYMFSEQQNKISYITKNTSAGGMCVNDAVVQSAVPSLPFGGVGNSGMGKYHGKYSFDTFTHFKPFLHKGQGLETANLIRYPPYDIESSLYGWAEWALKPTVKY